MPLEIVLIRRWSRYTLAHPPPLFFHLRRLQGNGYIRAILLYVNYPPYLPKISGESNEFYSALSLDIGEFIVSMIVSLA